MDCGVATPLRSSVGSSKFGARRSTTERCSPTTTQTPTATATTTSSSHAHHQAPSPDHHQITTVTTTIVTRPPSITYIHHSSLAITPPDRIPPPPQHFDAGAAKIETSRRGHRGARRVTTIQTLPPCTVQHATFNVGAIITPTDNYTAQLLPTPLTTLKFHLLRTGQNQGNTVQSNRPRAIFSPQPWAPPLRLRRARPCGARGHQKTKSTTWFF